MYDNNCEFQNDWPLRRCAVRGGRWGRSAPTAPLHSKGGRWRRSTPLHRCAARGDDGVGPPPLHRCAARGMDEGAVHPHCTFAQQGGGTMGLSAPTAPLRSKGGWGRSAPGGIFRRATKLSLHLKIWKGRGFC